MTDRSPQRVKLAAATGQRLPAFCTASSKAILAYSPMEVVQRVLGHGMPRYTQNTLDTKERLLEDLYQTRERGYALSEIHLHRHRHRPSQHRLNQVITRDNR